MEGKVILAITNHAGLPWSNTFQNVNHQLLTWKTVFAAYPKLQIVHHAGQVHSNVNPTSRIRQRVPHQQGPTVDVTQHIFLDINDNPLRDMYSKLGEKFEEKNFLMSPPNTLNQIIISPIILILLRMFSN